MWQCYMQTRHSMKCLANTLSTVLIGKIHHYVRDGVTEEIINSGFRKESLSADKRFERKLKGINRGGMEEV